MKAMIYRRYGTPENLRLEDIETPRPGDGEVLVRIHATSLNSWDWELLAGVPFANRMMYGLLRPRRRILGSDIAGTVEEVGSGVGKFRPGDEVLGDISGRWGGLAEHVCAPEGALTLKPNGLTFAQAASLPQAGLLALQGLRAKKHVEPGHRVLINGAGGGAGTFAVQIAKSLGAEVAGVDSGEKLDLLLSIGADHVFDYRREDPLKVGSRYDLILDFACHRTALDYLRALADDGAYVMVGGATKRIFQVQLVAPWISLLSSKRAGLLMARPNKDMHLLLDLVETGTVVPVIDRTYPLTEAADALRLLGGGHAQGKLVILI